MGELRGKLLVQSIHMVIPMWKGEKDWWKLVFFASVTSCILVNLECFKFIISEGTRRKYSCYLIWPPQTFMSQMF